MHHEDRAANCVLALLSAVSLALLSLPLSTPVRTAKACLFYLINPVPYYGYRGVDYFSQLPQRARELLVADIENRRFQDELRQAQWAKAEVESLKRENERLRRALELKLPAAQQPLWVRVMERDPSHWYRSFLIDAGRQQGIAPNAPVLGYWGGQLSAIGRVVEAHPKSAQVLLITDELSSAAAYVVTGSSTDRRSYEGLLQGQGGSRLLMNYLASDAAIQKGARVFTSPTSATFPPDILLGTVDKIHPLDPFLAYQSVEIRPIIPASSLSEVVVLRKGVGIQENLLNSEPEKAP